MLIDWEQAGAGRPFEIQVGDIFEAWPFYESALGAKQTFQQQDCHGRAIRLGLAVGAVHFTLSSETPAEGEKPVLSVLADGFGAPFIAIVLYVEDPDRVACQAIKLGSKLTAASPAGDVTIVMDPFGSYWALMQRPPADGTSSPAKPRLKDKALH